MRSQVVWAVGRGVGEVLVPFRVVGWAKTRENSDFATKINEINVELSGSSQRYVNECCESESDGKIDGFGAGCCKRRGGSPLPSFGVWCHLTTFEDKVYNNFDKLLQKMDAAWTENTALREAYRTSREETAALKAAMDALMKRIDETIATTAPPSPDTVTSSTMMEEMTMQLSVMQYDIQDVLEAVRYPPSKRKRCTSNQEAEPTIPMNQWLATQWHWEASLEHSLMLDLIWYD
jgi:hypothetical protein